MTRLLAIDDDQINLITIHACLSEDGYKIDQAEDGEQAWALMQQNDYDLILLDRVMPTLDSLGLLKRIKAEERWKRIPVIMQTSAAKQQDVRAGLEAGAHYYLTKPYEPEALRILVHSVLSDMDKHAQLQESTDRLESVFGLLECAELSFKSLEEARRLAATLSGLCSDRNASAMGLTELLINAVEHGNLGITYDEKSKLRQTSMWEYEIARRLVSDPWRDRKAHIHFQRFGHEIEFTITDQGKGFDWKPFLDFDAKRAFDLNGRGIAMARMMGFSSLEYQGKGNCVVARANATLSPTS